MTFFDTRCCALEAETAGYFSFLLQENKLHKLKAQNVVKLVTFLGKLNCQWETANKKQDRRCYFKPHTDLLDMSLHILQHILI